MQNTCPSQLPQRPAHQTPRANSLGLWPVATAVAVITAACGGAQGGSSSSTQASDGIHRNARALAAESDSTEVLVTAKGTPAAGVYPDMELHVDGAVVQRVTVNASSDTAYPFTVTPAISPGAKVDVVFVNDGVINGQDRNLWVESVTLQGKTLKPTDADVVYDRWELDGRDVIAGQTGMWWSGALRFAAPMAADDVPAAPTPTPTASTPATTTPAAGTPASAPAAPSPSNPPPTGSSGTGTASPTEVSGKAASGPITAKAGQVIENLHISTTTGPCIVVPSGVKNVVIRNNEIGPCGNDEFGIGVSIQDKASNITVQRNVIHDVSSGVYAAEAQHPIVIDRNFVYNVHGPMPRGQMVQFNTVSGGQGRSKITCNVSDKNYGSGTKAYEDHISMFRSSGTVADPIEIANNRIRGGTSTTGSGMMLGDYGGANIWVHHNTLVWTANTGIGIAGGTNFKIESNRIDNRGDSAATATGLAASVANFSPNATSCSGHSLSGNRGISRSWVWGGHGELNKGFWTDGQCGNIASQDNNWEEASLSPAMFDEVPAECQ